MTPRQLWANSVVRDCLLEAGGDVTSALEAAQYIVATTPADAALGLKDASDLNALLTGDDTRRSYAQGARFVDPATVLPLSQAAHDISVSSPSFDRRQSNYAMQSGMALDAAKAGKWSQALMHHVNAADQHHHSPRSAFPPHRKRQQNARNAHIEAARAILGEEGAKYEDLLRDAYPHEKKQQLHTVYADWLEENDLPEYAQHQRILSRESRIEGRHRRGLTLSAEPSVSAPLAASTERSSDDDHPEYNQEELHEISWMAYHRGMTAIRSGDKSTHAEAAKLHRDAAGHRTSAVERTKGREKDAHRKMAWAHESSAKLHESAAVDDPPDDTDTNSTRLSIDDFVGAQSPYTDSAALSVDAATVLPLVQAAHDASAKSANHPSSVSSATMQSRMALDAANSGKWSQALMHHVNASDHHHSVAHNPLFSELPSSLRNKHLSARNAHVAAARAILGEEGARFEDSLTEHPEHRPYYADWLEENGLPDYADYQRSVTGRDPEPEQHGLTLSAEPDDASLAIEKPGFHPLHHKVEAALSNGDLGDEHRSDYKHAHYVLGRMSKKAKDLAHMGTGRVVFHPNQESIRSANPNIAVPPDSVLGGTFSYRRKELHQAPGHPGTPRLTAPQTFAHELFHAIGGNGRYERDPEWQRAFKGEPGVSNYAYTDPYESFAEFGRVTHGTSMPLGQVEKEHPLKAAFFKKHDLWPVAGPSGGDYTRDLYDKKVPTNDGGHFDVLRRVGSVINATASKAGNAVVGGIKKAGGAIKRGLGFSTDEPSQTTKPATSSTLPGTGELNQGGMLRRLVHPIYRAAAAGVHRLVTSLAAPFYNTRVAPVDPTALQGLAGQSAEHHVSQVREALAKAGIRDMWAEPWHANAVLRSHALTDPRGFDELADNIRQNLAQGVQFGVSGEVVKKKFGELDQLKREVAEFHERTALPVAKVLPEHYGKRGASQKHMELALDHLESGGDESSTIKHLVEHGGLEENTARRYAKRALELAGQSPPPAPPPSPQTAPPPAAEVNKTMWPSGPTLSSAALGFSDDPRSGIKPVVPKLSLMQKQSRASTGRPWTGRDSLGIGGYKESWLEGPTNVGRIPILGGKDNAFAKLLNHLGYETHHDRINHADRTLALYPHLQPHAEKVRQFEEHVAAHPQNAYAYSDWLEEMGAQHRANEVAQGKVIPLEPEDDTPPPHS